MSKWFEVEITAFKTVVVEMPDFATDDDAQNWAMVECGLDYSSITEANMRELRTEQEIDTAKRHADQVEAL